jgi:HTH-type transcriptional regulator/antitoxin HigA
MNTTRMSGRKTRGTDRAAYQALVASFAPRRIHQEKQLTETMARIDELLTKSRRTAAEDDYLVLLSDVVEEWESKNVDIPEVHGVELVRALLKDRNLRQHDLVGIFGTDSIVSEVLSGKRELQRKHIEQLARFFKVSPAAFFPSTETVRRRKLAG